MAHLTQIATRNYSSTRITQHDTLITQNNALIADHTVNTFIALSNTFLTQSTCGLSQRQHTHGMVPHLDLEHGEHTYNTAMLTAR